MARVAVVGVFWVESQRVVSALGSAVVSANARRDLRSWGRARKEWSWSAAKSLRRVARGWGTREAAPAQSMARERDAAAGMCWLACSFVSAASMALRRFGSLVCG